jgi:methyl-accepting chemotaxis protein
MSISSRLNVLLAALGAVLLGVLAATLIAGRMERARSAEAERQLHAFAADIVPLADSVRELQIDVIQVQQFLTDASATHHTDSFDDAARYAADFRARVSRLRTTLAGMDSSERRLVPADLPARLDAVAADFQPYYTLGVTMAHAYIDHGIEAGNSLMQSFDPASDALFTKLDGLNDSIRRGLTAGSAEAAGALDRLQAIGFQQVVWIAAIAAAGLLVCLLAFLLVRVLVIRPLLQLAGAMRRLAARDMQVAIIGADRRDEVGGMARAVQVFKDGMRRADQLAAERAAEQAALQERTKTLVHRFETRIGTLVGALSTASTEMEATAQSMASTAAQTRQQAGSVAGAAEAASLGVQTVASAADKLTAAIGEISRQVAQSARMTSRAVEDTRRSDSIVSALSDGAQEIGDVVRLINSIARQTNLLALNATIEAARAGETGTGFAVVAAEVKGLAQQTAQATEQIADQVSRIQVTSRDVVAALQGIATAIAEVSNIANAIAAAVDEQRAATAEIADSVQQTAASTDSVTATISGVGQAAHDTGAAASQVLTAAGELSRQAEHLNTQVTEFVAELRAA